jgi:predicted GNAT family N-acyltransferase
MKDRTSIYGGKVIDCVMLRPTGDPAVFKLRQMAVCPNWQRKGIGRRLISAAEELLHPTQVSRIVLHARFTASGFYSKLGYTITSDTFTEVGIPHVAMEKELYPCHIQ